MDYFPAALENLVEQFAKLPGLRRGGPAAAIEALRNPS